MNLQKAIIEHKGVEHNTLAYEFIFVLRYEAEERHAAHVANALKLSIFDDSSLEYTLDDLFSKPICISNQSLEYLERLYRESANSIKKLTAFLSRVDRFPSHHVPILLRSYDSITEKEGDKMAWNQH